MAATARCEEIANQKFSQLILDEDWLALEEAVQIGPVQGFGKRLSSILSTYLSKYDTEATIYFDKGARNSKRQLMESKALDFVYPAYTTMLGHVRSKALEDFKVRLEQSLNKGRGFATYVRICTHSSMLEFDKGCADAAVIQANWDASRVREKLQRDIDAHASSVRSAKLSELNVNYEQQLSASLTGPVKTLLETGGKDTWASIRKLLNCETEVAISEFSTVVADFELDEATIAKMLQHLRDYSRNVVEKKAREEATKIMIHMKDRFSTIFNYDSDSTLRVWTGKEDITSITKDARSASLKLLSVMAAIRLDEKPDHIEKVLFSSLMDGTVTVSSSQDREIGASVDPLASSNWEEVSSKNTLITPVQCQSLWRQFIAETENSVTQAISAHVMATAARCEEIANQKFSQLILDEDWLALEEAVQIGPVQGFGKRLSSILSTYLSKYDTEATIYFDKGARNSKRQLLESKVLDFVYLAYTTMLGHVRSKALEDFKVRLEQSLNKGRGFATYVRICTHSSMLEFDKGCADAAVIQANWDASRVREKLQRDIDAHASSVRSAKLSELNVNYEQQLSASLTGPVKTLLETGGKDTWASIRKLLNCETEVAISEFSTVVADFELDEATIAKNVATFKGLLKECGGEKSKGRGYENYDPHEGSVKDLFSTIFNYDSDSTLRVWTGKEDITSITKDARSASLKLLSVMAAIRLDEKPDHIEKVLFSSLMDGTVTVSSSQDREIGASVDPLASSNWEEVSSKNTLITPVQCQSLWRQFIAETENSVTQAISAHVMATAARCEEIANQKFSQLILDEDWLALEEAVQIGPVQGFGKRLSSILSTYLSKYDTEATIYFDKGARNSKRQLLESKVLDFVYLAYTTMLGHVRSKALEDFKVRLEQSLNKGRGFATYVRICTHSSMLEFDKGCADAAVIQANWDASRVREKLQRDIDAHASSQQLSASLTGPVKTLLETGGKDTWASIRKLLNCETEVAISEFSTVVADFELDEATIAKMFSTIFNYDSDSTLRVWTGKEDITSITKDARSASLKLLSVMAAIRLDEKPDHIEKSSLFLSNGWNCYCFIFTR
ncbi:hypothetical protein L3X38_022335 [Prunus dulcis]|uniref:Sey1/RHD3-like three-helix bundle domain-containing protein n=1 Tax=Prunus dulcis TaxID=3755 RepID=A0AAD4VYA7_PRUDU|nr:hypothetical protein L3X38_022335 [Prunus dulcis]